MKDYLCKCSNCDRILIDENPQTGAPKIQIGDTKVYSMEYLEDEGGYFWGCPHCLTDGYLTDNL